VILALIDWCGIEYGLIVAVAARLWVLILCCVCVSRV